MDTAGGKTMQNDNGNQESSDGGKTKPNKKGKKTTRRGARPEAHTENEQKEEVERERDAGKDDDTEKAKTKLVHMLRGNVSKPGKPLDRRKTQTKAEKKERQERTVHVSNMFKINVGKTIGEAMGKQLVDLIYKKLEDEHGQYYAVTVFNDIDTEENKEILHNIMGPECPKYIRKWMEAGNEVFKEYANFMLQLQTDKKGTDTILQHYKYDISKAVRDVVMRQELFDSKSGIGKGLSRYDLLMNSPSYSKLQIDDSAVLTHFLSSDMKETHPTYTPSAVNTSITLFKEEAKRVFCPVVMGIMQCIKYDSVSQAGVFAAVVKFVTDNYDFYSKQRDLPGEEFRNLLVDVNIKILSDQLLSVNATTADANQARKNRDLLNGLKKIQEHSKFNKDSRNRLELASDITLLPENGSIKDIPMKPYDLLKLCYFMNAINSLEKRGVFTNGFFRFCIIMMLECFRGEIGHTLTLNETCYNGGTTASLSGIASDVVRGNMLRSRYEEVVNQRAGDTPPGLKRRRGSETSSPDGSEDSEEDDSLYPEILTSGPDKTEARVKSALADLFLRDGGDIFTDSGELSRSIAEYVKKNDFSQLLTYAYDIIDTNNKNLLRRMAAAFVDIITKQKDYIDVKSRGRVSSEKEKSTLSTLTPQQVMSFLWNGTDYVKLAAFFITGRPKSMVDTLQLSVLQEDLLQDSTPHALITNIIKTFFVTIKKNSQSETDHPIPQEIQQGANYPVHGYTNLYSYTKRIYDIVSENVIETASSVTQRNGQRTNLDCTKFKSLFSPIESTYYSAVRRVCGAISVNTGASYIFLSSNQDVSSGTGAAGNVQPDAMHSLDMTHTLSSIFTTPQYLKLMQAEKDLLQDGKNQVLSLLLMPTQTTNLSQTKSDREEFPEIQIMTSIAKGLFNVANVCIELVKTQFNRSGDRHDSTCYIMLINTKVLDKVLNFISSVLQEMISIQHGSYLNMSHDSILSNVTHIEGVLASILPNVNHIQCQHRTYTSSLPPTVSHSATPGNKTLESLLDLNRCDTLKQTREGCPVRVDPPFSAKATLLKITENYMAALQQNQEASTQENEDKYLATSLREETNKAMRDKVSNRGLSVDLVRSQMGNTVGLAAVGVACIKMMERDVETGDLSRAASIQLQKQTEMAKNTLILSLTVSVGAAMGLSKLSNNHFYDVVKHAGSRNVAGQGEPRTIQYDRPNYASTAIDMTGRIVDRTLNGPSVQNTPSPDASSADGGPSTTGKMMDKLNEILSV